MGKKKNCAVIMICCVLCIFLCGCKERSKDTKVVLTTGFEKDEIFRIETISCYLPEVMVYLTNAGDQYESVYGREIWEKDLNGATLEESVKDTVLAQLAQIKTMNLMAQQHGVVLEEEELVRTREAASAYYASLNQTERELMQADESVIERLYAEFALANKVYENIIRDINPEISDDEARNITVQRILVKTYAMDGTGKRIAYTESARKGARETIEEVHALAMEENADFEALVLAYSEGEKGSFSFGKGEMEEAFEKTAFNLETGEISEIIETSEGYEIIKCISTFNREETDANKIKIVERWREEVFGEEYDAFVATLTRNLNEELWESITLIKDDRVRTKDFFDIYNQYFTL